MAKPSAILDAHHHVWNPDVNYHPWLRDKPVRNFRYGDYSRINRVYLVPDYLADAGSWPLVGSVYVETEWNPDDPIGEMEYVAGVRRDYGLPSVAVAQAFLDHANVARVLERLAAFDFVRGVRHKPRANASPTDRSPGGMSDPRWRAGIALLRGLGLRLDLQTPWWHLHEAAGLARDFPYTQIILNHTGLPADRSAAGLAGWREAMRVAAQLPNIAVKISGIGIPGRAWSVADNRVVVLTAIELFGVSRCMFASNFPVDGLCATFDQIYAGFDAITADFSASNRASLFHDNAVRIYGIPQAWLRRSNPASAA